MASQNPDVELAHCSFFLQGSPRTAPAGRHLKIHNHNLPRKKKLLPGGAQPRVTLFYEGPSGLCRNA